MVLPIHDEIIFLVPDGEEIYVKDFKHIMEDTLDTIKNVPMEASVDWSSTNWGEKVEYDFTSN